jgi:2-iminobutanoate/2-iminopropanoate deaminase
MSCSCQNKKIVTSEKAPKAIGPYSIAVRRQSMVYTSGQLGLDPATGNLAPGGIEAETRQVLTNLQNVLEAAGSNLDCVLKTTVFLRDMGEFAAMNAIYGEFFQKEPPARATVQVAALPRAAAVQIEAIAYTADCDCDCDEGCDCGEDCDCDCCKEK